jgi:hypothetical protein
MVSPIAIEDEGVSGQRVSEEEESKKKGRLLPKDFGPKDYHVIIGELTTTTTLEKKHL